MDALKEEYELLGTFKNGPRLWCLDWVEVMVGAERNFHGLKARWVMWLDVPKEMRKHEAVAYKEINGKRDTQFGINAGSPAFILDDPQRRFLVHEVRQPHRGSRPNVREPQAARRPATARAGLGVPNPGPQGRI